MERLVVRQSSQEVAQCSDKGVLVSDYMSGAPEVFAVRVLLVGHHDPADALHRGRFRGVEVFEPIQVLKVEPQHAAFALDLESVAIQMPDAVTRCFEASHTAVFELEDREHGVFYLASRKKDMAEGGQFPNAAVKEQREIDGMRQQIANHPMTRLFGIHFPVHRSRFVRPPLLLIDASIMEYLSEPPRFDQLFGVCDGWNAAIIEPDHRVPAVRRGRHGDRFFESVGERLLAEYDLASLQCGDCSLTMEVVGKSDIDNVDVASIDDLSPVAFGLLPPPGGRVYR